MPVCGLEGPQSGLLALMETQFFKKSTWKILLIRRDMIRQGDFDMMVHSLLKLSIMEKVVDSKNKGLEPVDSHSVLPA